MVEIQASACVGGYETLARAVSRGEAGGVEVLAERVGRVTVRASAPGGTGRATVVVKLWRLSDWRSVARRAAGRTKGACEWAALSRLHPAGVAVAQPLAFFRLDGAAHHEALVVGDLSPCAPVGKVLQAAMNAGDGALVEKVCERVVAMTGRMVSLGVVDSDHRLGNFVWRGDGSDGGLFRVDFENARVFGGRAPERAVGVMLGALSASAAWATRKDPGVAVGLVERLLEALRPSDRVRRAAEKRARADLADFRRRTGEAISTEGGWWPAG